MRSLLVIFMASCAFAYAQVPEDSRPATSNIMGAEYPRIHPDLWVTFRANAPGAQNVWVESQGTSHEFQTWRRALYDFAARLFHKK